MPHPELHTRPPSFRDGDTTVLRLADILPSKVGVDAWTQLLSDVRAIALVIVGNGAFVRDRADVVRLAGTGIRRPLTSIPTLHEVDGFLGALQ